jgi:hypothetical protein
VILTAKQLGQNIGLFLAALMDRWIDVVMSARNPRIITYFDNRARYGVCFGLLYFLLGAVAVDQVLQKYWPTVSELSNRRIADLPVYQEIRDYETRYVFVTLIGRIRLTNQC